VGTGIGIALALVASAAAGFAVGAATGPASATPSATPVAASSAAPTPTVPSPSTDAYVEALDDSLQSGSETLAEGQSQRNGANAADKGIEVLNWVETDDPVFFITIDDGLVHSPQVREVIERYRIPVTAFLTEYAVRNATEYFDAVTAYGGSVQNHTMVHGALNDPKTDVEWEICETQDRFEKQFGYRPWMLRPPYGAGPNDPEVLKYSQKCGINRIVMWNVVVTDDNKMEYWEPPIKAGDIVLLHWVDGLDQGLEMLIKLGEAQGLRPAALEDYI
jgi:peptidoglycan/xylan/chitin deacetylase (PgdA/CDA1 family)